MNVGGLGWAAIGGLISVSIFFLLPFLLFLIAGLMCLLRGRKPKGA